MIIYINDPLCSWCYGFAPEATKIKEKYKEVADFRLLEGGLRPDGKDPLGEEMKAFLKEHWEEVHHRTGQPFSDSIFNKPDFIFTTEPPCRAVVTMRKIKPEAEFEFLKAVQNQFYYKGRNTNKIETYLEILPQFGVDPKRFIELFESEEMKTATLRDFQLAESLGIAGFPAIVIKNGDKLKVITYGYDKFEKLEKHMDKELLKK